MHKEKKLKITIFFVVHIMVLVKQNGVDVMNALVISVIAVLLVIFLIISLECVMRRNFSYIYTTVEKAENCIEAQLRILLKKNPRSEIIVINKTQNPENEEILKKLAQDFPEIHIIKADS